MDLPSSNSASPLSAADPFSTLKEKREAIRSVKLQPPKQELTCIDNDSSFQLKWRKRPTPGYALVTLLCFLETRF